MTNSTIEALYRQKECITASGKSIPFDLTVIPREHGEFLYDLVHQSGKGCSSFEIGMAFGLSTLFLCQAHHDNGGGAHVAVDPYQSAAWDNAGLENLKRANLNDYCELLQERSMTALPRLYSEGQRFDVAFIDGNHRFEYVLLDFFYIDRMLNVGGHIVFHDAWMPATRKVLAFVRRNHGDNYIIETDHERQVTQQIHTIMRTFLRAPFDLSSALALRGVPPSPYATLQKRAHIPDNVLDNHWDHYAPF